MRLLGIDYGGKRVGVALSDEEGKFALPHAVFDNNDTLIQKIRALCDERNVEAVVVGESKNLDGSDNPIHEQVLLLKQTLADVLSLPVYLEPEFYTSAEAERIQGKTRKQDASAAALILRSYIARKNNGNY